MINILFIHQSAELYGSDKTLLIIIKQNNFVAWLFYLSTALENSLEKEEIKVGSTSFKII
jgi:hypothetical protein